MEVKPEPDQEYGWKDLWN